MADHRSALRRAITATRFAGLCAEPSDRAVANRWSTRWNPRSDGDQRRAISSELSSPSISRTSSIRIKKSSSPTTTSPPQSPSLFRSLSSSIIEAGTLEELVDLLFDNLNFAEEFFYIYPYFATTSEVIQLL